MAEYFTKDGEEYNKVSNTLFTQEEVDTNIIPNRLERERKKFEDYDDLKQKAGKVDTITKEFEGKLKAVGDEKTDLEKQLGIAKLETDKVKILGEFKLSDELAEFVTGDTVDEMRQRAEKLSKGIPGAQLKIDKKGKPGKEASDSKSIARNLFGKKSDD